MISKVILRLASRLSLHLSASLKPPACKQLLLGLGTDGMHNDFLWNTLGATCGELLRAVAGLTAFMLRSLLGMQ